MFTVKPQTHKTHLSSGFIANLKLSSGEKLLMCAKLPSTWAQAQTNQNRALCLRGTGNVVSHQTQVKWGDFDSFTLNCLDHSN